MKKNIICTIQDQSQRLILWQYLLPKVQSKIGSISLMIIVILGYGCGNDFLDIAAKNQLSDVTFWKTEKDINLALVGCYNNMEGPDDLPLADGWSDNAWNRSGWQGIKEIGNGTLNASLVGRDYFGYEKIRRYNTFLIKAPESQMDKQKLEFYLAEVRCLRAYDYFKKVYAYGDVPLVTDLLTPDEAKLPRNSRSEVISFILKELSEASMILPIKNNVDAGGHWTKGAALALKARIELYESKWNDAMADADQVIKMDCYQLSPKYYEMFLSDNETTNKEAILSAQWVPDFYSNDVYIRTLPAIEGGWAAQQVTQNLVDAYECSNGKTINDPSSGYNVNNPYNNRDPRLNMTVICPGQAWNGRFYNSLDQTIDGKPNADWWNATTGAKTGYCQKKYMKPVEAAKLQNSDFDVVIFRLAEVYLTYAEASIESNSITDKVYDYINIVRRRAGMPDVNRSLYNNQSRLRELIRRERRVELALEGTRFYDIARWNIGAETMSGNIYTSRHGHVDMATGEITFNTDIKIIENRIFKPERKYLWPIAQKHIDANPNLTQTPGY